MPILGFYTWFVNFMLIIYFKIPKISMNSQVNEKINFFLYLIMMSCNHNNEYKGRTGKREQNVLLYDVQKSFTGENVST